MRKSMIMRATMTSMRLLPRSSTPSQEFPGLVSRITESSCR